MTRKSPLQPVPDPPSGGIDVAELRRNLAPAAPGPLQAVQTSPSGTQAAAEARNRLQRLRSARQAAIVQLVELDQTIERAEAAINRTQLAQSSMQAIEDEVAEATRRWIADGARGDAPTLSAAQRQALDAARADLASAERQRDVVNRSLETLRTNRGQLATAIGQAAAEIRAEAVNVLAEQLESAVTEAIRLEHEASAARGRALALMTFLREADYSGTVRETVHDQRGLPFQTVTSRLGFERKRLNDAPSQFQPSFDQHSAALPALLERLVVGEEK